MNIFQTKKLKSLAPTKGKSATYDQVQIARIELASTETNTSRRNYF